MIIGYYRIFLLYLYAIPFFRRSTLEYFCLVPSYDTLPTPWNMAEGGVDHSSSAGQD